MTNFELSIEDLTFSSLEGDHLQHFLQRVSNQIEHHTRGVLLSIPVYVDDPWMTLNGFHEGSWKYVPENPQPNQNGCYGHLICQRADFPKYMELASALHRHFRAHA